MNQDDDLFSQAMSNVRQLQREARRVVEKKQKKIPRTKLAQPVQVLSESAPAHRPERSETPWVMKADGVSAERMRQLGAGRPAIDMEIDLHGMTQEKTYAALAKGMEQALAQGCRVLCVIHGRGLHSKGGRSLLREAVYRWLQEGAYAGWVLAAMPRPGSGGGAVLILLRRRR